jgi:hypothetical protein
MSGWPLRDVQPDPLSALGDPPRSLRSISGQWSTAHYAARDPCGTELLSRRHERMRFPALADLIGLLTDQDGPRRYYMSPLGPTTITELSIRELVLAIQVVLRERFRVSLELFRVDRLPRDTVKHSA